jgi:hypothetical protein
VSFVRKQGALIPGDAFSFGYVVWNVEKELKLAFAFERKEYVEQFIANPKYYVDSIYNSVKSSPELVYLLNLFDEFMEIGIFAKKKDVLFYY